MYGRLIQQKPVGGNFHGKHVDNFLILGVDNGSVAGASASYISLATLAASIAAVILSTCSWV
jgi:hypothetical protein